MTQFEFLFFLYALILGLAVIELLSNFGATLERHFDKSKGSETFRFGWLTPLFALWVMLDLISFWIFAWVVRDIIELSPLAILAILTFTSLYYLSARLVFPTDLSEHPDLDAHYFKVRRFVLAMQTILALIQVAYIATIPDLWAAFATPLSLAMIGLFFVLLVITAIVKSKRLSIVFLSLLIVRHLIPYFF